MGTDHGQDFRMKETLDVMFITNEKKRQQQTRQVYRSVLKKDTRQ